ncbi:metallophosphoesterase family protein [Falsiroseomonas selenitidurans]|uniref:Metallophosphoesterase n=1 Tax=Falsiroseomonas selenitidurans TaxID=2716335 RepID=A0ABX1DXX9_9PROT|nr:metallophosphoesterase [Falsiroseomonas selenitidurans]NKC29656.1 metallophosphoesterase [Falsiroseomonas selenitidurans]
MPRIVFLSDLHLSPTHGFFWENFRLGAAAANAADPAAVVVNGDLCINGPDSDAEMAFAARALGQHLRAPLLALPGNHDVGDEPPGQDPAQIIDDARLARWDAAFGTDRFLRDVGAWRLIGLNAQLLGSGLAREAEQVAWLARQLDEAAGRPVALVLHKPLFVEHAGEDQPTAGSINLAPRTALLPLLRQGGVRMVISGHLHARRDRVVDGIRHLWLPALAFLGSASHGGAPAVGAVTIDFGGPEAVVTDLDLPGLVPHDLAALKGHGRYKFLRDMPECPPGTEQGVLDDAAE